MYDEASLVALEVVVDRWTFAEVESQGDSLARHVLHTKFMFLVDGDWAGELLALAEAGLRRIAARNEDGDDESVLLDPLRALLELGRCPADLLLDEVPADLPSPADVIRVAGL